MPNVVRTLGELVEEVRAITDREIDPAVSDLQIGRWLVSAYDDILNLWNRIDRQQWCVPFIGTIAGGNSFAFTPITPFDDVVGIRAVEKMVQTSPERFFRIKPVRFHERDASAELRYQMRGTDLIEIFPAVSPFTNGDYRVWYFYRPLIDLEDEDSEFQLPLSGDDYIINVAAAKIRLKLDEDARGHIAMKNDAMGMVRRTLNELARGDVTTVGAPSADDGTWPWDSGVSRKPIYDPQRGNAEDDKLESARAFSQLGPISRARPLAIVTIRVTETPVFHGMRGTPDGWFELSPTSASGIYQTRAPDSRNLYLRADVARPARLAVF